MSEPEARAQGLGPGIGGGGLRLGQAPPHLAARASGRLQTAIEERFGIRLTPEPTFWGI